MRRLLVLLLAAGMVGIALSFAFRYCWGPASGRPIMVVYGKIVDQVGRPVGGADVYFNASFLDVIPPYGGRVNEWSVHTMSAADGSFVINGGRGDMLSWEKITKTGYADALPAGPFTFAGGSAGPRYHPDANNPVVFMLWNDAYKRIISRTASFSPARNGFCTLYYLSGDMKDQQGGGENLKVAVHQPSAGAAAPFDWSVDVSVLGGGIASPEKELGPEAPATGYKPEVHFDMHANDPHWSREVVQRFYSRGRGKFVGNAVYASVELDVALDANDETPTVTVRYTANFGNARDLSPGPVTPVGK